MEAYVDNPQPSTILVVSYKEKKVDGRSRLAKVLKEKGELLSTKKLYDNQLPEWATEVIRKKGFTITQKALVLLVDHIGNDLNRIANEIDKLSVNVVNRKEITEDDIESYVGVSKEYNVFELQNALARKDLSGCIRIIQYFDSNPKAAPIQLVLPAIYNFFSKVYQLFGLSGAADKEMAAALGVNPFFIKDYKNAARIYQFEGVERVLLLLHQYNLKSLGIGSTGHSDGSLLKEMVYRMIY
jgi:DNA polymerase-3 subunit delta